MRGQFVETASRLVINDDNVVLMLGDIGVHGFRNILQKYPDRALNIGILEQTMVGMAAGMSLDGLVPIVHTIAPFLVERALEQIKIDFAYQNVGANIITVGASYDYSTLGCTHHCPADVSCMLNIPNVQVFCPGNSLELDRLLAENYNNGMVNYFRLTSCEHSKSLNPPVTNLNHVHRGKRGSIVVVGYLLDRVMQVAKDLDLNIFYLNSLRMEDLRVLSGTLDGLNEKFVLCCPFYGDVLFSRIVSPMQCPVEAIKIDVPVEFLNLYGTQDDIDRSIGLDECSINKKISSFFA